LKDIDKFHFFPGGTTMRKKLLLLLTNLSLFSLAGGGKAGRRGPG
jgi:hypothetical protein